MNEHEKKLLRRRVQLRSFDWKSVLTGTLENVEKYVYVLRLDAGGLLYVQKHSTGAVAAVGEEE